MIEYLSGDILESEAQALVNSVNCVGVMGKGLALQFKQRYTANILYEKARREGRVRLGHVLVFELEPTASGQGPQFIINFPTKQAPLARRQPAGGCPPRPRRARLRTHMASHQPCGAKQPPVSRLHSHLYPRIAPRPRSLPSATRLSDRRGD